MNNEVSRSFYVQWHILDRCNLRCRHCYQSDFSDSREPAWPGLRFFLQKLLDTMEALETTLDVAVTGGEPFLAPELLRLMQTMDASPRVGFMSIISNGTIWPEYAGKLSELGKLKEIRISLDGITPATNDAIRGNSVLYGVLGNIAKWRNLDMPVTLMFTVMKRNLHEVPRLVEFGKTHGLTSIIIERFFPLGRGEAIDNDVLSGEQFLEVWQRILEQVGITAEPADLITYRGIRIRFDESEPDIQGSGCVLGKDGLALLPDGTVLPCRRFPLPIGNISSDSLLEVWQNSPVLEAIRNKDNLKGKCASCNISGCIGCRAMCYCLQKDFLAEDPHCWLPG
ncbi:MAG: radical SAM protein [bacterium]|nr:radical SAM protein [bacterium]